MSLPGPLNTRVLLLADESIVRTGLVNLINLQDGVEVVAAVSTVDEARRYSAGRKAQVIVVTVGEGDEIVAIRELIASLDGLEGTPQVLVLSANYRVSYVKRVLQCGAAGVVLKAQSIEELVTAVKLLADGKAYVPPAIAVTMARDQETVEELLTDREREVLRLVALGYTNGQIADELYLSPRTVEAHRSKLSLKLDSRDRRELVRYALEMGLVP